MLLLLVKLFFKLVKLVLYYLFFIEIYKPMDYDHYETKMRKTISKIKNGFRNKKYRQKINLRIEDLASKEFN